MTNHHGLSPIVGQQPNQQFIGSNRPTQRSGVVAQFTDFGRFLVHETDDITHTTDRVVDERRIATAVRDCTGERRFVEISTMTAYEKMQTKGIAPSHFKTVKRRQGVVHRTEGGNNRSGFACSTQRTDALGDTKSITEHRPQHILDRSAGGIEILGNNLTAGNRIVGSRGECFHQGIELGGDLSTQTRRFQQRNGAGNTQQQRIEFLQRSPTPIKRRDAVGIECCRCGIHQRQHLSRAWHRTSRLSTDNGNNSAHKATL